MQPVLTLSLPSSDTRLAKSAIKFPQFSFKVSLPDSICRQQQVVSRHRAQKTISCSAYTTSANSVTPFMHFTCHYVHRSEAGMGAEHLATVSGDLLPLLSSVRQQVCSCIVRKVLLTHALEEMIFVQLGLHSKKWSAVALLPQSIQLQMVPIVRRS